MNQRAIHNSLLDLVSGVRSVLDYEIFTMDDEKLIETFVQQIFHLPLVKNKIKDKKVVVAATGVNYFA